MAASIAAVGEGASGAGATLILLECGLERPFLSAEVGRISGSARGAMGAMGPNGSLAFILGSTKGFIGSVLGWATALSTFTVRRCGPLSWVFNLAVEFRKQNSMRPTRRMPPAPAAIGTIIAEPEPEPEPSPAHAKVGNVAVGGIVGAVLNGNANTAEDDVKLTNIPGPTTTTTGSRLMAALSNTTAR